MTLYRYPQKLKADPNRVILQFFNLSEKRKLNVLRKIVLLSDKKVSNLLEQIFFEFSNRHYNLEERLLENFSKVERYLTNKNKLSLNRKLLIGAYFSKEYSIESAALFNPSLISHPDQSGLKDRELRFILSLRATGEGHISSIEFRTGVIDKDYNIKIEPVSGLTEFPKLVKEYIYSKHDLKRVAKYFDELNEELFNQLPERFTREDLNNFLSERGNMFSKNPVTLKVLTTILDYIDANYEFKFKGDKSLSNYVIFPLSKSESGGMEDLRLVKFNNNGNSHYYGTYTAYNGYSFKVQMLETDDFNTYRVKTLHGSAVKDKGMALFPRRINNKYLMISRQDGEDLSIMLSKSLDIWEDFKLLQAPDQPWEFIQLGNCGSPIETKEGWLLITHAVGPFRKYVIAASLLDLNDPTKVIAMLREPLISPDDSEREGYVPNVVYSCGSLIYNQQLIIPYAMSDSMTGFARIPVNKLLSKMK